MAKEYKALPVISLHPCDCIAEYIYLPRIVHLEDSALDAMIDFQQIRPLKADSSESMMDVREEMQRGDLHMTLIFDGGCLVGLLSLEQILGQNTLKMIESRRVERKDILVNSVMTPLEDVAMINFDKLKYAQVGHIVSTLKESQRYYLLVVEDEANSDKKIVRGVFLASTISKLLGERIKINPAQAKSIAELQKKLHQ